MATLTGPRAAPNFPVPSIPSLQGVLGVSWGYYNILANPTAADIIEFCRVPAGAVVIGGFIQGIDIDTGTEALDIDFGWAANGTDAADPDGFGNMDVLTGDVSVHLPVAGIYLPFAGIIQSAGYKQFAAVTTLTATVNVAANATGTGMLKMVAFFEGPGVSTP